MTTIRTTTTEQSYEADLATIEAMLEDRVPERGRSGARSTPSDEGSGVIYREPEESE